MRNRPSLNKRLYAAVLLLGLVLLASCNAPRTPASQIETHNDDQEALNKHALVQFDAREKAPEASPTHTAQEISGKDGSTILENNCIQCHLIQSLLQIKKSRIGWEEALGQMEAMGVRLSETEKTTLLDYLATNEEP